MKTDSWYHSPDANAPKWPAPKVEYEHNTITDYVLDDNQDSHVAKIEYSLYHYDFEWRIAELKVTTKANYSKLQNDVLELIDIHEDKRVILDCTIEVIKPTPH